MFQRPLLAPCYVSKTLIGSCYVSKTLRAPAMFQRRLCPHWYVSDSFTCPCLWVGTSLGSVLVIVLNLPPEGDQRMNQPVIVSPSGRYCHGLWSDPAMGVQQIVGNSIVFCSKEAFHLLYPLRVVMKIHLN